MKEIKIKLYKFSELTEEIQEKIFDKYEFDDLDVFINNETYLIREEYKEKGISIGHIYYNLSYSQGDGVR